MYNFGIMLTKINLIGGVLQEVTILSFVDLFDSIDSGRTWILANTPPKFDL